MPLKYSLTFIYLTLLWPWPCLVNSNIKSVHLWITVIIYYKSYIHLIPRSGDVLLKIIHGRTDHPSEKHEAFTIYCLFVCLFVLSFRSVFLPFLWKVPSATSGSGLNSQRFFNLLFSEDKNPRNLYVWNRVTHNSGSFGCWLKIFQQTFAAQISVCN